MKWSTWWAAMAMLITIELCGFTKLSMIAAGFLSGYSLGKADTDLIKQSIRDSLLPWMWFRLNRTPHPFRRCRATFLERHVIWPLMHLIERRVGRRQILNYSNVRSAEATMTQGGFDDWWNAKRGDAEAARRNDQREVRRIAAELGMREAEVAGQLGVSGCLKEPPVMNPRSWGTPPGS